MKKVLLVFGSLIPATAVFCQQDLLLKKFKYRIDHYRAVGFNLGANGYYNHFEPAAGKVENSTANGAFNASYYTVKSTDRIMLTTNSGLSGSYGFSENNNQSNIDKIRNFVVGPYSNVLNRWFSQNNFIELGAIVSGNFSNQKSIYAGQPAQGKYAIAQYSVGINTGIGRGRLENVTDMQNALWLNKALTDAKSLSRTLTMDELNELGRSITKGNNTRVLDSRRRTQFILKTVDDYLQQNGLIATTDINYFSNLNDILFFAFNSPRFSGTEKFIRFTPAVYNDHSNQDNSNGIDQFHHRLNNQSLTLSTGFSKYIPVSLTQQNNYGASAKFSYVHADLNDKYFTNYIISNEVSGTIEVKQAAVNLFYQHSIYPNTRTVFNLNAASEAGYQDVAAEKNFYADINLAVNVSYFISYRTRLTAGMTADYQKNGYALYQYVELIPDVVRLFANVSLDISL